MARRRCCCPGECYVFYDQFNRSDSTDLGADWTEVVGYWSIVAKRLVEVGTADAKAITTAEVPADSAGEMDAFVQVYNYSVGDVYRLYVAWDSTSEYYMLQVTYLGGDEWYIELCHNTSVLATATQQATVFGVPPTTNYVVLQACIDSDGNFQGGVISTLDEMAWITDSGTPFGRKAGVGHDNTGGAVFDEFYFTELRTDDIVCSACWCHCNGNVPSKRLLATVYNATDRAACLDGLQCYLDYDWNGGVPFWSGTIHRTGGGDCDIEFKVLCDATIDLDCPGREWTLENLLGSCCTNLAGGGEFGCTPITPDCDTSTCWPLNLVFGPFEMRDDDLICGCCYAPGTFTDPITFECTDANCVGYYYIIVTDSNE